MRDKTGLARRARGTLTHGSDRRRWRRATVATALAAAAVASGCMRPPTNPAPAGGTYATEAARVQAGAPDTRPWFCNATGQGTPPSGHGNGHIVNPYYAGKSKGPLSWADCLLLARQLDQTVAATRGIDTKAKGEAAGYVQMAKYIGGLGTHHVKLAGLAGTAFDPAKPTNVVYGGDGPDAPLVGVAFSHFGPTPPEPSYAGGNDWWHLHKSLCSGGNVEPGEELTDEECKARGGTVMSLGGQGVWLLHVWLYPPYEYRPDLFVSGHPCLLAKGVAPQSDPCWSTAHTDPSKVPSTTMPDDHGADGH